MSSPSTQNLASIFPSPVHFDAFVERSAWPKWVLLTICGLLIAAPASTKVAGAAWFLIVLFGLWAALRIPISLPINHPLVHLSLLWFATCLFALILKAIATYYWADPWGDRHVEVRLLLCAAATFALLRRLCLYSQQKIWLTHSLALACWVALGVSCIYGRETPSNAIPWAAGVSFFVCILLPLSMLSNIKRWQRTGWFFSSLAGVVAILLSQSRGSYGIVLWVILFSSVVVIKKFIKQRKNSDVVWLNFGYYLSGAAATIVFAILILVSFPRIYEVPLLRVQDAILEVRGLSTQPSFSSKEINTSVGARIHMWRAALKEIANAPLLGHGSKARIAWIHQLGITDGSDTIKSVHHLHSDILTTLFDHGMLGLFSYLSFGISLAWIALKGMRTHAILSWSLIGMLLMHLTSGLTNVNFGHNYYGVMFALSLFIAWIQSMDQEVCI
ncbi:O-antigen ligase [Polaromonas sp. CG_9.11]|uniref:O-antigen ligase family protein n=1 Tax=Polaromonas sp. CG_9.11 TaxID=2787730 RepID=UPI0018CB114B|nr:O-antigen ligase family protein [Polaromonas sp. CG_9.11]MBG6076225.1 O-antigen ligase [Polaromonas sp. CG_9.11]